MEGPRTDNAKATEGLLQTEIPYCTAEGAHTVAETLLDRRAVEMATCVLGAQSEKKQTALLPNNTVKCLIQDLSAGTEKRMVSPLEAKVSFLAAA